MLQYTCTGADTIINYFEVLCIQSNKTFITNNSNFVCSLVLTEAFLLHMKVFIDCDQKNLTIAFVNLVTFPSINKRFW